MVICITYGDDINNILDISPWRAKNRRMSSGSHDPSSRQAALSLFLIGFITFSLLYAVQPLLPSLARRYALGSADSALALSVSTGALAFAIGLYVSGTALGGMTGRVGLGIVADQHGWTVGLLAVSGLSLLGVGIVWRLMPPAPRPRATGRSGWVPSATWWALLSDPRLLRLFLCGGLASGLFVSAYNYAGFRLQGEPFLLSPTQIGLIFCCYAF